MCLAGSSDRDTSNSCAGSRGHICRYSCDEGYNAYGLHTCQKDGDTGASLFVGGICAPLGQVPLSCNGNVRVIPQAVVGDNNLAESSASQRRNFAAQQIACAAGEADEATCGDGGCFIVEAPVYNSDTTGL